MASERARLLFVVTEDWYFHSHRLPLAVAALDAGYAVAVATRVNAHRAAIEACGCEVIPLRRLRRRSLNPLREIAAVAELARVYRTWRPDIVHQVAMKPVLYGSLAALFAGGRSTVNALAGLGFVYSSRTALARLLRPGVNVALRLALDRPDAAAIVQNDDDARMLRALGLGEGAAVHVIRGSGVDLQRFRPRPHASGAPIVLLASRMLWDKGIGEFVDAARRLRAQGTHARFVLVGPRDSENPTAIPEGVLAGWQHTGAVEWWGPRDDMPEVLGEAAIVCLPSYREGMPKVLLEAAACGRPIVASDVPGCRDVVEAGASGLLVPAHDAAALAGALQTLLADADLRERMGQRARAIALARFGLPSVQAATLALYRDLGRARAVGRAANP
jgi:glycosyltransferase involved in cell wall biosynthesis